MRSIACAALALMAGQLSAQLNIVELGHYDYQEERNSNLSNLWGYVDEQGNEYALVGVNGNFAPFSNGGLSIVDVTDPTAPEEVYFRSAPVSIWREIKTWGNYAYVTTEAEAGLMIVDLSPLPESTNLPVTFFQGEGWNTSHSLFIDENGRLYLHGANRGAGGVIMYDLTENPMAPVEVGIFDMWYCHDSYARGDTLYAAHIYDGIFSIVDVSDPAAPVLLGIQETPSLFTHNCWLDDSGQFLYTTDEVNNAYVAAYDISDPSDIVEVDRLRSDGGSGAVPHNTYWLDHYLVTSYYTYGVAIYDATNPSNLVEVGHYDTSPFSGEGFDGAWGVYPFLPSGNLLVSDIEQGLFVLGPTYVRAAWMEGDVTNSVTSAPVVNATVTGVGTSQTTDLLGHYSNGIVQAGTFTVTVSADGYNTATIPGVVLENGETTLLDVQLVPIGTGIAEGTVTSSLRAVPVTDGGLRITGAGDARTRLTLLDAQGRSVRILAVQEDGSASLPSGMARGVYVLRAERANGHPESLRVVMP